MLIRRKMSVLCSRRSAGGVSQNLSIKSQILSRKLNEQYVTYFITLNEINHFFQLSEPHKLQRKDIFLDIV